ncbi:MAG: hypothetical protein ACI4CT_03870 [Lachnospiraceae bacterium]
MKKCILMMFLVLPALCINPLTVSAQQLGRHPEQLVQQVKTKAKSYNTWTPTLPRLIATEAIDSTTAYYYVRPNENYKPYLKKIVKEIRSGIHSTMY